MPKAPHEAFASELRTELEARGRAEGRVEGRVEGRAEGRVEGQAKMLFEVLAARGIELDQAQRERVFACEDESTFFEWLHRALGAESADEVFTSSDA